MIPTDDSKLTDTATILCQLAQWISCHEPPNHYPN